MQRAWCQWISSLYRRSGSRSCTYSWCWHTIGAALSISASQRIQRRSGQPSNFVRRSRGTVRLVICCGTETGPLATSSPSKKAMGIKQVLSAPRAPWQRAYVERLIGSIRRECLDHVIVINERSLERTLAHSSVAEQGHTTRPADTNSRRRYHHRDSRSRWLASSLRTPNCLTYITTSREGYLIAVDAAATCRRIRFSSTGNSISLLRRTCRDSRADYLFCRNSQ